MATRYTRAIAGQVAGIGGDIDEVAKAFDEWKSKGPAGEYESKLFGKDGACSSPVVGAFGNQLRHVHLIPLTNPDKLDKWLTSWRRRGRKTSDRALVYTSDSTHGHLLIYILEEPEAHKIASMRTEDDRLTMLKFAKVADSFISTGAITI